MPRRRQNDRTEKKPDRSFHCPTCKTGRQFKHEGWQDGFDVMRGFDLWTCRSCGGTFSEIVLRPA